jgi:hypothetical protein
VSRASSRSDAGAKAVGVGSSAWFGPYAADAAVQREGTATAPQYPYLFIGQFLGGMGYLMQLNTCLANSSHPTALRAIGRT